jgi:HlyD family secretion protein
MDTRAAIKSTATRSKKKQGIKARRSIAIALSVFLVVILAWFFFRPNPLPVETATVEKGPMQVTINNQGQVRVHDKYVVAAPIAAKLERIDLHDGDPVQRNQVLATLDPLPMDAKEKEQASARLDAAKALAREAGLRVRRAEADMQLAISERARIERLVKGNFISQQAADKAASVEVVNRAEWAAARSREKAAIADMKVAEAALIAGESPAGSQGRRLSLKTPTDGYVLKIHERSERIVPAGTPLITIGDTERYEIMVDVLSTDAVKIKPGNLMLLEAWGGGKTLRAGVRLVEPVAFTKISALGVEEQRVNVIADPIDPLGPLGDGYRIEARIVVWAADDVVSVAGSSVFRVGDAWHVFTVENGRAVERAVEVGARNQDKAQIISGLNPGSRVIRYPSNEIEQGKRIIPSSARGNR